MITSKHNIIMIHGYEGNSENHFFPYITTEIEKHGVEVFVPQMPAEHTVEQWMQVVESFKDRINENTILIGHSLGCAAILHILAILSKPVFGTVFVGGFGKAFGDESDKEIFECNSFVKDIAWKKVRTNAGAVKLFASTNDPEIPTDVSIHLGTMMKSPIHFIENAGHFCADDGYTTFPELLDYLLSQIYMTYEEFKKLDARVGHIKKVEEVEGADKLLRFEIDFGVGMASDSETGLRQIVSGIREYFPNFEELVGKKALYVLNLAPREIKGVVSYGMLMAVDGVDNTPMFLIPDGEVNPGAKVR